MNVGKIDNKNAGIADTDVDGVDNANISTANVNADGVADDLTQVQQMQIKWTKHR